MKLQYVTLTGADEKTNISDLKEISKEYPFVEWAFLLSSDGKSDRARYPSLGWIANAVAELENSNIAIHLWGSIVGEYLYGIRNLEWFSYLIGYSDSRVQINLPRYIDISSEAFKSTLSSFLRNKNNSYLKFILQHTEANSDSISEIFKSHEFAHINNLQILRDCSGGRGVREDGWKTPSNLPGHVSYGFAGGIGPDTVENDLIALNDIVGDNSTWIDMESKIRMRHGYRDGNRMIETNILDLDACRKVLEISKKYA